MPTPHPILEEHALNFAVLAISDTRTEASDKSGQFLQKTLVKLSHKIVHYTIVPDEPGLIKQELLALGERSDCQVILLSGGTGFSRRDCTCEVLEELLEKKMPGFGELFRYLSYLEVGSRAIASRSIAGTYHDKLIFALPGSLDAVKLGLEKLILPELSHLSSQLGLNTTAKQADSSPVPN